MTNATLTGWETIDADDTTIDAAALQAITLSKVKSVFADYDQTVIDRAEEREDVRLAITRKLASSLRKANADYSLTSLESGDIIRDDTYPQRPNPAIVAFCQPMDAIPVDLGESLDDIEFGEIMDCLDTIHAKPILSRKFA